MTPDTGSGFCWCGWLAAVLGSLTLTLPLSAQPPAPPQYRGVEHISQMMPAPMQAPPGYIVPVGAVVNPPELPAPVHVPTPTEHHLIETLVKVVLLGDPVTFPYVLSITSTSAGLTISGYVPTQTIRQRVLDLTKLHTNITPIDKLRLQPTLLLRMPVPASAVELGTQARNLLLERFPDLMVGLRVSADSQGRVHIAGGAVTPIDQLAICECLRNLDTCACVTNRLLLPGQGTVLATAAVPANPNAQVLQTSGVYLPNASPYSGAYPANNWRGQ